MRAVRVVQHAAPLEALELQDIPVPEAGPGEVLVEVSAASLNFGDIARCRGTVASVMGQVPFTIGMDVCGVVDAAGDGAEEWIGRRGWSPAPTSRSAASPTSRSPGSTACSTRRRARRRRGRRVHACRSTPGTSRCTQRAQLQAGETLLVVGGASAVGTAMIQLGTAAGARTSSPSPAAPTRARSADDLGAEPIDYQTEDLFDRVMDAHRRATAPTSPSTWSVAKAPRPSGRAWRVRAGTCRSGSTTTRSRGSPAVRCARCRWATSPCMGVMMGYNDMPLEMRRFGINTFPPSVGREVHAALLELVAAGKIRPYIGRVIVMEEVAQALDDHEQRKTSGRTVVSVQAAMTELRSRGAGRRRVRGDRAGRLRDRLVPRRADGALRVAELGRTAQRAR